MSRPRGSAKLPSIVDEAATGGKPEGTCDTDLATRESLAPLVAPPAVDEGVLLERTQQNLELRAEIEAHERTRQRLMAVSEELERSKAAEKKARAELEVYVKADAPTQKRLIELEAEVKAEKREKENLHTWKVEARKKINEIEELHWKRSMTQTSFDADGWREWLHSYSAVIKPLIFEFGR